MFTLIHFLNDAAAAWSGQMFAAVWQSAVLALLILAITPFLKRTTASLRFALWMLVPLRLLLAALPTVVLPVLPAAVPQTAMVMPAATDTSVLPSGMFDADIQDMPYTTNTGILVEQPLAEPGAFTQLATAVTQVQWGCYLLAVWLAGVVFCLYRFLRGWRDAQRLAGQATLPVPPQVLQAYSRAALLLNLKHTPRIIITDQSASPFVMGILRPVVVLPKQLVDSISEGQLLAILAHEFAHIRRRDAWWGLLLSLCEILYFFHPLLYVAKKKALLEREKACDEWVLALSQAKPASYARALALAAGLCPAQAMPAQPAPVLAESFGDLKERMKTLTSQVRPKAGLSGMTMLAFVMLALMATPKFTLAVRTPEPVFETSPDIPVNSISRNVPPPVIQSEPIPVAQPPRVMENTPTTVAKTPRTVSRVDNPNRVQPEPKVYSTDRILQFPQQYSMGIIHIRDGAYHHNIKPITDSYDQGFEYSMPAQQQVVIPAGKIAFLQLNPDFQQDWGIFRNMPPDAFFNVSIACPNRTPVTPWGMECLTALYETKELSIDIVMEDALSYLPRFTGLERFYAPWGISDKGMAYVAKLPWLKALHFRDNALTLAGTDQIARLTQLEELSLWGKNFPNEGFRCLVSLSNLQYLSVPDYILNDEATHYIAQARSLRSFKARYTHNLTDLGFENICQLNNLEQLSLNCVTGITNSGLKHLQNLPNLRTLSLGDRPDYPSQITDMGMIYVGKCKQLENLRLPGSVSEQGIIHITGLKNLRHLWCGESSDSPIRDEALFAIASLPHLEELHLSGRLFGDKGLKQLGTIKTLKNLSICSDSKSISDAGLQGLSKATNLESLTLFVDNCSIAGLNSLNTLTQLKCLKVTCKRKTWKRNTRLDLSRLTQLVYVTIVFEQMQDEDIQCFSGMQNLKWLQGLSGISDTGLSYIANLKNLEIFTSSWAYYDGNTYSNPCTITDRGLTYLTGMSKLKTLYLHGNFTGPGLQQLNQLRNLTNLRVQSTLPIEAGWHQKLVHSLPNLEHYNQQPLGMMGGMGG